MEELPAYIAMVEDNPGEAQALCQDLLIGVTSFFRDPESFEELSRFVLPRLTGGDPAKSVLRIWVPGCSSGEEVYSIAICLLEYLGESAFKTAIQIFGTDVSEPALELARAGTYTPKMLRGVSEERLKRFFVKVNGHYQIAKSIRDLCIFSRHDVTRDPPFSRLDLISCRNLLIYLDPVMQKRVIPLFHYALSPGAVLMLGPSESIGGFSDLFSLAENKKVYIKNALPTRAHLGYLDGHHARGKPESRKADKEKADNGETWRREADRIALSRYAPAGVMCDENLNVLEFRGDTAPYLSQPSGPPNVNLRQLSRPGLLLEISSAVDQARREGASIRRTAKRVQMPEGTMNVRLEVIPISRSDTQAAERWFLIFFEKTQRPSIPGAGLWAALRSRMRAGRRVSHDEVTELKRELAATREHMRVLSEEHEAHNEELKAAQEELLSSNEEFQSTNEELETAKEELQSSNEELLTTNDELHYRNSELTRLNVKLEEARSYADAIVETIHEPLLVLEGNLRIVRANAAFYNSFRLTPGDTEGVLFYELDNRQWNIPELRKLLEDVLPEDTSFQNFEITSTFPAIGEKTMLLNGRHLAWEKHDLILLAIEDITEQKMAHNILDKESRRKDEFLAMLGHELRNPLASIRNALEIWRRGDAGEEAEKEAQMVMDRQLLKETRLVDDLLDVSRITSGSIALKKEPVDFVEMVNRAVEGVRHQLEARQHSLELALPDKEVIVKGDAVRLEQIISNLLTNAAKYTEPGGHIVLTLKRVGSMAVLTVADNGIGIDSKLLPRIFDLFVQATASLDRAQGGLGIGLTLVRRLVELQGGTIEAKSRGLKQGSEFTVRLPLSSAKIRSLAEKAPAKNGGAFTPHRILVVDDNADSAKTSALLLELEGHEVQIAVDGPSALKAAQEFRPEIILLDIGLPGMNGYEVARKLRRMPETKSTQLIALTGYGQADDRRRSREAGFDAHLVKPAEIEQLKTLISEYESNGLK